MKIVLTLLLLSLALADSCGGNCPSGNCKNCFCGAGKNMVDITAWCAKYSWNQNCCKCIVSHESAGNAHATTLNENGSANVGLWQINTVPIFLVRSTGTLAVEEAHLATPTPISPALSRSTKMEVTPGNHGNPALPAAADRSHPLYIIFLKTSEVRSLAVCLCGFRGELCLL